MSLYTDLNEYSVAFFAGQPDFMALIDIVQCIDYFLHLFFYFCTDYFLQLLSCFMYRLLFTFVLVILHLLFLF